MCAFCDKTRQFARNAWRRFRPTPLCCVRGCKTQSAVRLCKQHFQSLPLAMRQRWWRETGYSTREPSAELVASINQEIGAQHGRQRSA